MNKIIHLFTCGIILLASCQKEEIKKEIQSCYLENLPTKTSYVLNEPLLLEGISIKVTYSDGTHSQLGHLPKEWLKGFSSEKPVSHQEVRIQPTNLPESQTISFFVDILPLKVVNNEIVEVVDSEFKTITVPEGIKSIHDEAFGNKRLIEKIELPSTLEKIGSYTFYASPNLKVVDLSKTVLKELPSGTFESCAHLTQVLLPETLKQIGGNAFYGTMNLQEMILPEGVEEIGNTAFSNSGIISIKLPNSIRTIKRSFYHCDQLKEVITYGKNYVGADQERSILGESFQHCPNLEVLQIPGGVKRIGMSVLGVCKVKKLVIPENVEHIEFNAFGNATSLEEVELLGEEKKTIEEKAFPPSIMDRVVKEK